MSIEVTIEGLDRWLDIVDPVRFTREIDAAVVRAAQYARDDIKRMPPVSSQRTGMAAKGIPVSPLHGGTLRGSIQMRKVGEMVAEVYAGAEYGVFVHDGVRPFELNKPVFIPTVGWRFIKRHPGVAPRPFFKWWLTDFGGIEKIDIIIKTALEHIVNP